MKVQIDQWLAVATWKWDIEEDMCSICRNIFEMPCGRDGCKYGGEDCSVV